MTSNAFQKHLWLLCETQAHMSLWRSRSERNRKACRVALSGMFRAAWHTGDFDKRLEPRLEVERMQGSRVGTRLEVLSAGRVTLEKFLRWGKWRVPPTPP